MLDLIYLKQNFIAKNKMEIIFLKVIFSQLLLYYFLYAIEIFNLKQFFYILYFFFFNFFIV